MSNHYQILKTTIKENLKISSVLTDKIFKKIEPFINTSMSKQQLLKSAKEWKEYYENR